MAEVMVFLFIWAMAPMVAFAHTTPSCRPRRRPHPRRTPSCARCVVLPQEVSTQLMKQYNCYPVFLGAELKANYYKSG